MSVENSEFLGKANGSAPNSLPLLPASPATKSGFSPEMPTQLHALKQYTEKAKKGEKRKKQYSLIVGC